MPIFMDRHDVSEAVTAEIVADLHQKDLKIQHNFNCKGLTYWFDDKRKTAFCLVEAPNKEAIQKMHDHAHGSVPHRIIEVDGAVVESFLGRIEDPKKSQNSALNIINDPAFRIILVAEIKQLPLTKWHEKGEDNIFEHLQKYIINTADEHNGRIIKRKRKNYLLSFDSVTKAVLYALKVQRAFQEKEKISNSDVRLEIGLCAGIPVSEKEGIFEDTILMAERLCRFVKEEFVITSKVADLYESENQSFTVDSKYMRRLQPEEEKFLNQLMNCIEKEWNDPTFTAERFAKDMGYSRSHFYRKIFSLSGMSPNSFIRAYRLKKALVLLNQKNGNISEIAYKIGFNSPAYFAKCFQKTFGILPSTYIKSNQF